ncbi:MAG: hypothetical protein ACI4U2_02215 [Christensenellaceae bacterium]
METTLIGIIAYSFLSVYTNTEKILHETKKKPVGCSADGRSLQKGVIRRD